MSRHTQGSLTIVGAIAAGIFLVAFVALMVLGDYGFSAAAFLSILIALVAAVVLYLGFGGSDRPAVPPAASKPAPAPKAEAASEPAPEPAPAPTSQRSAPGDGANALKVSARTSRFVSWPSFSKARSHKPGAPK